MRIFSCSPIIPDVVLLSLTICTSPWCCCEQDDWGNYTEFTKAIGKEVQVVGDDLLVTNVKRIEEASAKKACNALLLKVRLKGWACEYR